MKTLIVYYSRTGVTKKLAEILKQKLNADIEEISCATNYQGAIGYLKAGREAALKLTPEISPIKSWLENYDLIIVGTPVWAFTMASPVRTFLKHSACGIKKVAFFRTQAGAGSEKTFTQMAEILGQEPKAELVLLTKEVMSGNMGDKLEKFLEQING